MRTGCSRGAACLIVMLALGALAFGGSSDSALLRANGGVVVNGIVSPTTTALFTGDKVQTADGGSVTIVSPGSMVLAPQNSEMVFNGGVLDLAEGTASISTTQGMTARVDKYMVSPATGGTARFEIKKTGGSILVRASSGSLTVAAPGHTFTLAEGATATFDSGANASKATTLNAAPLSSYVSSSATSFFNPEAVVFPDKKKWCVTARECEISPNKRCKCYKDWPE